jgi:steroid delta-isomerase-like uncharacterized protein
MGIEENKVNIRRQVEEFWNKGDFSSVPELISPDFVYPIPNGELKGHDGFKQWVKIWHTACPDFHMTINKIVGEDDTVVVSLSWTGTFTGKFMDYEPTGNKIIMTEAWFIHFKDGKDTGPTPFANLLSLFQQMGIYPPNL